MKFFNILIAIFFFSQVDAKDKFYKWTDEEGNIHYTNKKPKNKQIDEVKVYAGKPTIVNQDSTIQTNTDVEAELTAEQKAVIEYNQAERERVQAIQDRENCIIAKKNKETLEKSFSVKRKNPASGEYIKMDKAEINKKLKEVNKSIKKLCK